MAKRKAAGRARKAKAPKKSARAQPSGNRPILAARRPARVQKKAAQKRARRPPARSRVSRAKGSAPQRLNRVRRTLEETVPTPPSSLNMARRGSAARTGRAELAESRKEHAGMTPAITGGDVDANLENAYFSGDEAPGGDNPTPDQDIVDDIGKALGVEYQDNEELRSSDKVADRDKRRWELDPASSEDYKDRK